MLFHLLKNHVYIGEIVHGEASAKGLHAPIVGRALFDQVQAQLAGNTVTRAARPLRSADLPLKGRLFDADGHPMSPSFGYGRGAKVYRYYVSAPLQLGRGHEVDRSRAIRRVSAEAIHEIVCNAVGPRIVGGDRDIQSVAPAIRRVDILPEDVRVVMLADRLASGGRKGLTPENDGGVSVTLPVRCKLRGGRVDQVLPPGAERKRVKRDPALVRGLQQSHRLAKAMGWSSGDGSLDDGPMKGPKSAHERKLVRLSFLAPDLQRAILEGRQAPGLTLARLLHEPIPTDWAEQRRAFG